MHVDAREAAYVEFVTARETHLRRIAYAICGDWQLADEILQTALTRLYVAWPRVRRLGVEDAYVRRIIVRAHVDEHRRRRQPEGADHDRSDRTALFDALQALPVMQRKTVVLRHWLGLSVEETAEELGISTHRVEGHSARALVSLRRTPSRETR
jgi:RNA polymerase sigma factor (sigma-70 family)